MPNKFCKICNAFGSQPNILNSINLDIFAKLKTWREIGEYYTPFLPEGFSPIRDTNIAGHKRHTDVSLLLRPLVVQRREIETKGENVYDKLYEAGKAPIVDYLHVMDMMLRARFEDLTGVERIVQRASAYCDSAVEELNLMKAAGANEETLKPLYIKVRASENRLFELIERRQKLWDELQSDMLNITGSTIEREKMELRLHILKGLESTFGEMMKILSAYIIKEAFANDIRQGRVIYNRILGIMNEVVKPALEPLDKSKEVIITKQKRLTA